MGGGRVGELKTGNHSLPQLEVSTPTPSKQLKQQLLGSNSGQSLTNSRFGDRPILENSY